MILWRLGFVGAAHPVICLRPPHRLFSRWSFIEEKGSDATSPANGRLLVICHGTISSGECLFLSIRARSAQFLFQPLPPFLLHDLKDAKFAHFGSRYAKSQTRKLIGSQDRPRCFAIRSKHGLCGSRPFAAMAVYRWR